MRGLLEQGYEIAVIKDATAAAQTPELGDGYASALTNFGYIANAVRCIVRSPRKSRFGQLRSSRPFQLVYPIK